MLLRLSSLSSLLLILPFTLGGQIPVVDGIIGGVPNTDTIPLTSRKLATRATTPTTPGKLRLKENSGVCETTPGVYQASGYADLASNKSIFFWYFSARENNETAPLALWFNGGPGSSSMIGLFQELGPCRINPDGTSVSPNPYSWNTKVNMLFIDQPIGVGFSHGELDVGTSQEAAGDIWLLLQIFLGDGRFEGLGGNELAVWTESYGGHYGPTFAAHFLSQNKAISEGKISGIPLNLKVLGVGNGMTDPLTQYPGYITYSSFNPYHPLVNQTVIDQANSSWFDPGGCKDQITACYNGAPDSVCSDAQSYCNDNIITTLIGDWDVYYVPVSNPDPYPTDLTTYLNSIASQIGAESEWEQTNVDVYNNFALTGDWMRNSRPDLETVIDAGVRVIIYDGDADFILNFNGVEALVNTLNTKPTSNLSHQPFKPYTVNGQIAGQYKNSDKGKFSYVRVYGAGHEVPAYKYGNLEYGQAAFQMFSQIMEDKSLFST